MNNEFVSVMYMDDKCRFKNVLWAKAQSQVIYEYFGDVITFNMTYLKNRYDMSFASLCWSKPPLTINSFRRWLNIKQGHKYFCLAC